MILEMDRFWLSKERRARLSCTYCFAGHEYFDVLGRALLTLLGAVVVHPLFDLACEMNVLALETLRPSIEIEVDMMVDFGTGKH